MSFLSVYAVDSPELPNKVLDHEDDIAATLAEVGVYYSRRPALARLLAAATGGERPAELVELMNEHALHALQLLELDVPDPAWLPLEQQCLEPELRLFLHDQVLFCMHAEGCVFALHCSAGDLLHLPAGSRSWLDHAGAVRLLRIGRDAELLRLHPVAGGVAGRFARYDP
jgi:1,2-dihydroxy-3-keto-5-methylthiopentene dioxygenase